jgi:hypothetical protein
MSFTGMSEGKRMKFSSQVFLVFMVFFLVLPMHSHALDNQKSSPNSMRGNLTGPTLFINKIPVHCVNEIFNVTGTTSLPAGIRLRVMVYRGSFNPGIPPQRNPWYNGLQKEVRVVPGMQQENTWTYVLNTSGSYPDEYLVTVEPYAGENISATAIFRINETCDADGESVTTGDSPGMPRFFYQNGTLLWNNILRSGADTMVVSGSGEKTVTGYVTSDTPSFDQQGTPLVKSAEARGGCIRCPPILNYAFLLLGIVFLFAYAFFYWLLKKYNSTEGQ